MATLEISISGESISFIIKICQKVTSNFTNFKVKFLAGFWSLCPIVGRTATIDECVVLGLTRNKLIDSPETEISKVTVKNLSNQIMESKGNLLLAGFWSLCPIVGRTATIDECVVLGLTRNRRRH